MQLRTHNTVKMLTSSSYPNKTSDFSGLPFCMKEKNQNIILNINVVIREDRKLDYFITYTYRDCHFQPPSISAKL